MAGAGVTTALQTLGAGPQEALPAVGDWVWLVFWRAFEVGYQRKGSWETALSRVISVSADLVCHEVSNPSTATEDAAFSNSLIRWSPLSRVFRTKKAADEACRTLPAQPTNQ